MGKQVKALDTLTFSKGIQKYCIFSIQMSNIRFPKKHQIYLKGKKPSNNANKKK